MRPHLPAIMTTMAMYVLYVDGECLIICFAPVTGIERQTKAATKLSGSLEQRQLDSYTYLLYPGRQYNMIRIGIQQHFIGK